MKTTTTTIQYEETPIGMICMLLTAFTFAVALTHGDYLWAALMAAFLAADIYLHTTVSRRVENEGTGGA